MPRITDDITYPLVTALDADDIALVVEDGAVARANQAAMQAWLGTGGGAPTGTKMTDLTAQNAAGLATADILETVDLSDTSMHSSGTNKKITWADVITFLMANGLVGNASGVTAIWTGNQATYDAISVKSATTLYFIQ